MIDLTQLGKQRFPVGTKFELRKPKKTVAATVIDHLSTVNTAGEVVKERYVVEYFFMGQRLVEYDVVEYTIALSLGEPVI